MDLSRKPRIGLLFIAAERFMELGKDTADGTYAGRKAIECEQYMDAMSDFADVVPSKIVNTREQAEEAAEIFHQNKVDCVVAIFLSWSEDYHWISFLKALSSDTPLMLASVVRDEITITDTNDENQFIDFLSAGALVGFLEGSGSFKRFMKNNYFLEIDTLHNLATKIKTFAKASMAKSILEKSTIGLLACYNEAMFATYTDPYNAFMKIGARLRFLSVADLCDEIDMIDDTCVNDVLDKLANTYRVHPNVNKDKFFASVKATMAMEKLATDNQTDLLVLNDIDTTLFKKVGLRPGFAPLDGNKNRVTVPEGDIGGGLATYILRILSQKVANFIEPFYINNSNGTFAAGHAGPNDYTECPENVIIARDERFAKSQWKHAGAPFAWYVFPEGEKTMLHMSEENGRMKMIATTVECMPTKHYLASYSHADFRHKTLSHTELFKRIAEKGATQHFAICPGDVTKELEALAKMMDFDYYYIGE
jgi:L-arabinose isomerase